MVSRRTALKGLVATLTGTVTGAAVHGYGWERHALRLVQTSLPVTGLPPEFEGLRVGFITDLHLSGAIEAEDIRRAVRLMQSQSVDVLVLGGDYVSNFDLRFAEPVAELLADLAAPLGVFAILGNHDDDRVVPGALARRGITVLKDARASVTRGGATLELAGVRFWTRSIGEIGAVVQGASAPVLLLAHDPRRVSEAASLGIPAVISGHTHGGQIVLPLIGALAARKFPVAAGRLTVRGTELFVSRGVGTILLPIRINCPPDVSVITLRRRVVSSQTLPAHAAG